MRFRFFLVFVVIFSGVNSLKSQVVFPGADEKTPSKAQFFSWINNTNEGDKDGGLTKQSLMLPHFYGRVGRLILKVRLKLERK